MRSSSSSSRQQKMCTAANPRIGRAGPGKAKQRPGPVPACVVVTKESHKESHPLWTLHRI